MTVGENQKKSEIKIYLFRTSWTTYVRICVFEAQKFVHLRAILADFPDTNHQELQPSGGQNMRLALFSFVVTVIALSVYAIPNDKHSCNNLNGMYNICISKNIFSLFLLDGSVAQFALTLEHLEVAYYTFGLQQFDEATFIKGWLVIGIELQSIGC
jgi:hypothetical protein